MSGILTIGVVLQDLEKDEPFSEKFTGIIKNPIIREIAIFSNLTKTGITQDEAKGFVTAIQALRPDIVIAVDHEGGLVQRLRGKDFTLLPKPDVIRQCYNTDQELANKIAQACGTITAYELSRVGIQVLYGPVFDTYDPNSTVIGEMGRSYGNPPDSTDLLSHYLEGINGCLYTIAKHFPDHGQVSGDTHLEIVVDTRSIEDICTQSLPLYNHLECDGLIIPNVIYSAVDEELPATLSKKTIELFTKRLEKTHLPLFSDALEMNALKSTAPTLNEWVVQSLKSGCDAISYGGGWKPESGYLDKIEQLLTFLTEKQQTDSAFLNRYIEAEEKLKVMISSRPLTKAPSKDDYEKASQVIKEIPSLEDKLRHTQRLSR